MPDEENTNKEIQKAMHKLFCVCTVFAAGVLLAAADISFKWDASGRNVAEPAGVSAAFASFDSARSLLNGTGMGTGMAGN